MARFRQTAGVVGIISALSGTFCIRGVSLHKNATGEISATIHVVGNETQVRTVLDQNKSPLVDIVDFDVRGAVCVVSIVDRTNSLTLDKVPHSAVFKSVPRDVFHLVQYGITSGVVPPSALPDAPVLIKLCNEYQEDGWTVSEILDVIGLDVQFPSALNYHVTGLSVTAGTPVHSFLLKLFPFIGVTVQKSNGKWVVSTSVEDLSLDELQPSTCESTESESSVDIGVSVMGGVGRPKDLSDINWVTKGVSMGQVADIPEGYTSVVVFDDDF